MAGPEDDDGGEWVPLAVAAERLGLARTSVATKIRRGDLEARKDERGRFLVRLPVLSRIAKQARRRGTLSAEEAVAATGVPLRVLWAAVYQRRLPVLRCGGELRFDPGHLEAWLEAQRVVPRRKEAQSRPIADDGGEELLTIRQAAARLGVAPATLWQWLNAAALPFVVAPGRRDRRPVRYVRAGDVERLAAQRGRQLGRDR